MAYNTMGVAAAYRAVRLYRRNLCVLLLINIFLTLSVFLLGHYWQHTQAKGINTYRVDFEDGDIIFRRGVSAESNAIRMADGLFVYSHVGIIRTNGSNIEVIHASYDEEGQTRAGIISEPIAVFLKPTSASAAAACRLKGENKQPSLLALHEAERFLKAETPFDKDFDLDTSDKLYCTELIWLAYKRAGIDLVDGKFDNLPFLLRGEKKSYLLPSSLFRSSHLQIVWTSQESEDSK